MASQVRYRDLSNIPAVPPSKAAWDEWVRLEAIGAGGFDRVLDPRQEELLHKERGRLHG